MSLAQQFQDRMGAGAATRLKIFGDAEEFTAPPLPSPPPTGGSEWVVQEMPAGAIDGSNTTFTTAHAFSAIEIYLNGLVLLSADYVLNSPTSFSLVDAPLPGDVLRVDYILA